MVGKAGAVLIGIAIGSYITGYAVASAGWVSSDRIRSIELALAGVIRKLKEIDFRTKDLDTRVQALERRVSLIEVEKEEKVEREEERCKVKASWLRIRSEPNTSSRILGYLRKGVEKKVLERKEGWIRIEEGWISGKYCEVQR